MLGGVPALCSFNNFPRCSYSLLLSIFCPLLPFHIFPCSVFISHFVLLEDCFVAPCSFLEFSFAPCSFLLLLGLHAPGLSFVCSLQLYLFYSKLVASLCQIGLAPCSGNTPSSSAFSDLCLCYLLMQY